MQDLVTVLPSGRSFYVYGNESILESALRDGIDLSYGCSNGNCGLCKAKLVTGEVRIVRHHDFSFRASEEKQILLCSYTTQSDLTIEVQEGCSVRDIPLQTIDARVNKINKLTENILFLRLQTPRTKRLRFLAGQSANLSVDGILGRSYSIASCPCDDRNILFHINRRIDNPFIESIDQLRKNDIVTIQGPLGTFVLEEDQNGSAIFIAFDTGFAPIKSLIEQAMQLDNHDHLYLYWIASVRENHYMDNLARSWADAFDNFFYYPLLLSNKQEYLNSIEPGHLEEKIYDCVKQITTSPDYEVCRTYIAGADPITAITASLLETYGVPPSLISTEITR